MSNELTSQTPRIIWDSLTDDQRYEAYQRLWVALDERDKLVEFKDRVSLGLHERNLKNADNEAQDYDAIVFAALDAANKRLAAIAELADIGADNPASDTDCARFVEIGDIARGEQP